MDNTIALIKKSHEGDETARAKLVEENRGLVWCVVKRFYGRGIDPEDLFQIGSIGLLKAIDKFNLSFEVKFSTYAVPMIAGEIKRFLRDDGLIKVSRSLKEVAYKAYVATEKMRERYGREPGIEEVAEEIGVEKEELILALEAVSEVESLQKTIYQGEGNEIRLMDKIVEEEGQEEKVLNHLFLKQLLNALDEQDRELICLRYFANKTQGEVGAVLGISQVQVSRREKKILQELRSRV